MTCRPLILALALAAALPALAGTPIDQTRPLVADGSLSIENIKGEIIVSTWDRPEVRITGELGEGVEELAVSGSAQSLSIEVKYPRGGGGWFGRDRSEPSRIEVRMPASAALDVDAVSASVDITGLASRRLSVDSVSGNVTVRDSRADEARFDLVSGDIDARVDSTDISIDTVSGDVRLESRRGGELGLDTVSGDADLRVGEVKRAVMDSVSGTVALDTRLAPGGRISADTVSGSVRLRLPADTSARISMETFSGGLSSPVGEVKTEKYGPGKSLEARLGSGEGQIQLVTFSGDARLQLVGN